MYEFEILHNEELNYIYSHMFFLFFCLKELAEQLKAQLEKANKFKETVTQISSKKSGVEVSNKSLFVGIKLPCTMLLGSGSILIWKVSLSVFFCGMWLFACF